MNFYAPAFISMPIESIIAILVFLIVLASIPMSLYPLVFLGGFFTVCWQKRSRFADGDAVDMAIGDTLAQSGVFADMSAVPHDLDSSADIDALLDHVPKYDGDELLTNQMKHVGEQAQEAIIARSRFTSDNFRGVFQEELNEGEDRDWWEEDRSGQSVKDGQNWELF